MSQAEGRQAESHNQSSHLSTWLRSQHCTGVPTSELTAQGRGHTHISTPQPCRQLCVGAGP